MSMQLLISVLKERNPLIFVIHDIQETNKYWIHMIGIKIYQVSRICMVFTDFFSNTHSRTHCQIADTIHAFSEEEKEFLFINIVFNHSPCSLSLCKSFFNVHFLLLNHTLLLFSLIKSIYFARQITGHHLIPISWNLYKPRVNQVVFE